MTKWISTKKKSPKKHGKYLVTMLSEDYYGDRINVIKIAYWTGIRWTYDFKTTKSVLAWQPLPKPYSRRGRIRNADSN